MMKIDIDLDDIQTMLMDFAKKHGLDEIEVNEKWAVDYKSNGQNVFMERLFRLLESMQLYKEAIAQCDSITAKCALVHAKVDASLLCSDFGALEEDLKAAIVMSATRIPEDFNIPNHYGFTRR